MKDTIVLLGVLGACAYMMKDHFDLNVNISGINDRYDDLFKKYGTQFGVNPKLLKAISANESYIGKYQQLEPIGGTTGIMHIKLETARQHEPKMTAAELAVPENEIRVATKHLSYLLGVYKSYPEAKREEFAVKAYNGGQGRMNTIITFGDQVKDTAYFKNMTSYFEKYKKFKSQLGNVA